MIVDTDQIHARLIAGDSVVEVGVDLGLTRQTIRDLLRAAGAGVPRRPPTACARPTR